MYEIGDEVIYQGADKSAYKRRGVVASIEEKDGKPQLTVAFGDGEEFTAPIDDWSRAFTNASVCNEVKFTNPNYNPVEGMKYLEKHFSMFDPKYAKAMIDDAMRKGVKIPSGLLEKAKAAGMIANAAKNAKFKVGDRVKYTVFGTTRVGTVVDVAEKFHTKPPATKTEHEGEQLYIVDFGKKPYSKVWEGFMSIANSSGVRSTNAKFEVGDKVVIPSRPSLGVCTIDDILSEGLYGAVYSVKTSVGLQRELEANIRAANAAPCASTNATVRNAINARTAANANKFDGTPIDRFVRDTICAKFPESDLEGYTDGAVKYWTRGNGVKTILADKKARPSLDALKQKFEADYVFKLVDYGRGHTGFSIVPRAHAKRGEFKVENMMNARTAKNDITPYGAVSGILALRYYEKKDDVGNGVMIVRAPKDEVEKYLRARAGSYPYKIEPYRGGKWAKVTASTTWNAQTSKNAMAKIDDAEGAKRWDALWKKAAEVKREAEALDKYLVSKKQYGFSAVLETLARALTGF